MHFFVFIGHFSYQFGLIDCTVNVCDQLYSTYHVPDCKLQRQLIHSLLREAEMTKQNKLPNDPGS